MTGAVSLILFFMTNVWLQLFVGGLVGILVYIGCCLMFNVINDDMLVIMKLKKKL